MLLLCNNENIFNDENSRNEKSEEVAEIKAFENFAKNAFALKAKQTSKVYSNVLKLS